MGLDKYSGYIAETKTAVTFAIATSEVTYRGGILHFTAIYFCLVLLSFFKDIIVTEQKRTVKFLI